MCVYIYIYLSLSIYIYIYICRQPPRGPFRPALAPRRTGGDAADSKRSSYPIKWQIGSLRISRVGQSQ